MHANLPWVYGHSDMTTGRVQILRASYGDDCAKYKISFHFFFSTHNCDCSVTYCPSSIRYRSLWKLYWASKEEPFNFEMLLYRNIFSKFFFFLFSLLQRKKVKNKFLLEHFFFGKHRKCLQIQKYRAKSSSKLHSSQSQTKDYCCFCVWNFIVVQKGCSVDRGSY